MGTEGKRVSEYCIGLYRNDLPKLGKEHLELLEKLLTTKSWWDTVDMLAQKPIGKIALESPEVIPERITEWAHHENMWLRRTAILFQLKYKDRTNEELLYTYIKMNASSTEFLYRRQLAGLYENIPKPTLYL